MSDNYTALTTARYEVLTRGTGLSRGSEHVLLDLLDEAIGHPAPIELYARLNVEAMPEPLPVGPMPKKPNNGETVKVGLCVGHSRAGDSGAVSLSGESEWKFNSGLAFQIAALFADRPFIEVVVYDDYEGRDYVQAMQWIAQQMKAEGIHFAIELHFNAATATAEGYEFLFWHRSRTSRPLAELFQNAQGMFFPGAKNRGVEPLGDQAHERGTLFTSLTHCPAIISETHFGSHAGEVDRYMRGDGPAKLIDFHAHAIELAAKRFKQKGSFAE